MKNYSSQAIQASYQTWTRNSHTPQKMYSTWHLKKHITSIRHYISLMLILGGIIC